VAGALVFYARRPDFHPVALVALNSAFMATSWLLRAMTFDNVGMFLLSALIIGGSVSGTIAGLIRLRKHMEDSNG